MFRLVLLTAPTALPDEARLLAALLGAGSETLHLRKPGWPTAQVEGLIQALPSQFYGRLVLHGHSGLVRCYGLGGLHLTGQQRAATVRRPLLLPGQTLSTSFHTLAEISRHRRRYDYIFLSPIFDSISKAGYSSTFKLPELRAFFQRRAGRAGYHAPVLALGGIAASNLALVQHSGFAGAAVLGTIWQSPDPVAALRQLQEQL
ncbi:thiamine phosphate synthase [Hymenobacter artigasi]|uniref:Thiamine-phosphate pyrophosphorylase n=1 Tax=Hymenobacter artigasi TaxID=2719616 RepID=A0ABX1HG77_9BACT|nr:thiamine phosphate synthase [Hymenobacter artigasi]NKI88889.1 thiamine-phosphate pyrophosphorylase [Hymenobacter artigasi]